jgi:RNA polymerase sigma factor (sigma-70 family)
VSDKIPGAEAELIKLFSPWLRDLIRRSLEPRVRRFEDSEDILQEALLVLAKKAGEAWDHDPEKFLYYMGKVARNKAVSANRRHLDCQKRQDGLEVDFSAQFNEKHQPFAPNPEPLVAVAALETWEWLMEKQPEPFQTVLRMKFQGYSAQEIGDFVHVNERTVRKLVDLLRKKFFEHDGLDFGEN